MSFLGNEPHFPLAGTLSSRQDAAPRPSVEKGRLPVCVFGEAQAVPFLIRLRLPPTRPSQDGRAGRSPLRSLSYNRFKSVQLETSPGGQGRLEPRRGGGWAWLPIAVEVTQGRPGQDSWGLAPWDTNKCQYSQHCNDAGLRAGLWQLQAG